MAYKRINETYKRSETIPKTSEFKNWLYNTQSRFMDRHGTLVNNYLNSEYLQDEDGLKSFMDDNPLDIMKLLATDIRDTKGGLYAYPPNNTDVLFDKINRYCKDDLIGSRCSYIYICLTIMILSPVPVCELTNPS